MLALGNKFPATVKLEEPNTATLPVPPTPTVILPPELTTLTLEVPFEICPADPTLTPVSNAPLPRKYVPLTFPEAITLPTAVTLLTPTMSLLIKDKLSPAANS